jgi:hypothetical protein
VFLRNIKHTALVPRRPTSSPTLETQLSQNESKFIEWLLRENLQTDGRGLFTFETLVLLSALYVVHFAPAHLSTPRVLCDALLVTVAWLVQVCGQ